MRIGIFGGLKDPQSLQVKKRLEAHGASVVFVDSQALNQGIECSYENGKFYYHGQSLDDVGSWYMRYIMSPLPPSFHIEEEYYLYQDWYSEYMQRRDRHGYMWGWLETLLLKGIPVVNPPVHGTVGQHKLYQLAAAESLGIRTPNSLITNSKHRLSHWLKQVPKAVYKPLYGGAYCEVLTPEKMAQADPILAAPVIFQEQIVGKSIRVTMVGNEAVSAVAIPTDKLDYRSDPEYLAGQQLYEPIEIPEDLREKSYQLMEACGLVFSGIDFIIEEGSGDYVFLEANSSPVYLSIEKKTGHPISDKIAIYLLRLANEPDNYDKILENSKIHKNFIKYALPFQRYQKRP